MSRGKKPFMASAALNFFLGATVGVALTSVFWSSAWSSNQAQSIDEYMRLLDATPLLMDRRSSETTRALMQRMMSAHHRQDAEAEISELAEGYAWIGVSEVGYQEMASGRDVAAAATRNLYISEYMKDYMGVEAKPIAIVGNIGVQLEHENFRAKDGSVKTTTSVTVYEVRQGKLLRLWAFTPTSADH
jgi:hypothetical protein